MGKENKLSKEMFPKYALSIVSFLHPLKNHCAVVVYSSQLYIFSSQDTQYNAPVNGTRPLEVPNNIKET